MARDVTYLLVAPYFGRNFFRKARFAGGVDFLEVALGGDVPVGSSGVVTCCSSPLPNVVEATGVLLFMPAAAHWR